MMPLPRNAWALLGLLALFALLLLPLPGFGTRLSVEVENFAHAPLFAAVALGCWRWLRAAPAAGRDALRAWLLACALAVLVASISELLQPLAGRDNSLHDFVTDLYGIGAALLLVAARLLRGDRRRHLLRAAALAAVLVVGWPVAYTVAAYLHRAEQAPRLLDLDSALGRYFLLWRGVRLTPQGPGTWLISPQQKAWAGITVDEVMPDWRGYRSLVVDVSNPGDAPALLLIRVDDRASGKRYADHYGNSTTLAPGARLQWRLPLAGLQHRTAGRGLDLSAMHRVYLYQDTARPATSLPYVLHELRLER